MFRLRLSTRPIDYFPHLKKELEKSSIFDRGTLEIKASYKGYDVMLNFNSDVSDIHVSDTENIENKGGSVRLKGRSGKYFLSNVVALKILYELDKIIESFEK